MLGSWSKVPRQANVSDVVDTNPWQKKIFRHHYQLLRKAKRVNVFLLTVTNAKLISFLIIYVYNNFGYLHLMTLSRRPDRRREVLCSLKLIPENVSHLSGNEGDDFKCKSDFSPLRLHLRNTGHLLNTL